MKRVWVAAILLVLGGCGDTDTETKSSEYVFGTLVDVTVRGVSTEKANAAIADLSEGFRRMHKDWHAWKPGGELMAVNAACKTGASVEISDFTLPLIRDAQAYYEASGGLFNAAVGEIVGAWGFHADEPPKGRMPSFDAINHLAAQHPAMTDVHIDGHTVTCTNPAVGLDFGGFAKGAAVDWALRSLKSQGIANAVISAGGNVGTIGSHGERPWRIGIRDPKTWGVIASVDVAEAESVYTSGNYERYREQDGVRYSHIIDPRTGWPVQHVLSTTVIAKGDGSLADAASTALTVAGPDDWPRIAKRMGIDTAMLVDDAGHIYVTPKMAHRLIFDGPKPELVVREVE